MKLSKWEKLVLQDLILLFVGAFLLFYVIDVQVGPAALIMLIMGFGFMGASVFDLARTLLDLPKYETAETVMQK